MDVLNDPTFDGVFDRRRFSRAPVNRGALLCISGLKSFYAFTVRDASGYGIGMRLHQSPHLLPIEFMIAEEALVLTADDGKFAACCWTTRRCRLVWREGDFAGAAFIDRRH